MNSIIKQIHSEFSEAEELLIKEVNEMLAKSEKADTKSINALSNLGFSNFKELRAISPEEILRVTTLKATIIDYKLLSPCYKFITEDKVISICKKYGLVHAPVDKYTDSIPTKNQNEILDFHNWFINVPELLPKEVLRPHSVTWSNKRIDHMSTVHIINTLHWIYTNWSGGWNRTKASLTDGKTRQGADGQMEFLPEFQVQFTSLFSAFVRELYRRGVLTRESIDSYYDSKSDLTYIAPHDISEVGADALLYVTALNSSLGREFRIKATSGNFVPYRWAMEALKSEFNPTPEYTIVAAQHMIDCKGMTITEDYKVEPITTNVEQPELRFFKDDDPIVLMKVDKGYLIVTAWGDEASDEDVVNHAMN